MVISGLFKRAQYLIPSARHFASILMGTILMKNPNYNEWPENELERVDSCPYCNSAQRELAYSDVEDWSFCSAPGKWNYYDCLNCQSLYLDPRPTRSSIGLAYGNYYTHRETKPASLVQEIKERLINEWLSHQLNSNLGPRIHLPKFLHSLFADLITLSGKRASVPFGWAALANRKKGRFMDVGCGAGITVALARKLGWDASGIEIDPTAVLEARRSGLDVVAGGYELLAQYGQQFDCILCSHVLEHVHDPLNLLAKLKAGLKPGGVILLSLPNSLSALRRYFGSHWRGLEAPRHISIPSEPQLVKLLVESGFVIQSKADDELPTAIESYRIQRHGTTLTRYDILKARKLAIQPLKVPYGNDFIQLVCEAPLNIDSWR